MDYYRKADFTLALTREVWAKLYFSQLNVKELAGTGALKVTGDAASCDCVLDLFDKFDRAKNTLIPPGGVRATGTDPHVAPLSFGCILQFLLQCNGQTSPQCERYVTAM